MRYSADFNGQIESDQTLCAINELLMNLQNAVIPFSSCHQVQISILEDGVYSFIRIDSSISRLRNFVTSACDYLASPPVMDGKSIVGAAIRLTTCHTRMGIDGGYLISSKAVLCCV